MREEMEPNNQSIDLIGDIHGHADELEAFFEKLGYRQNAVGYKQEQWRTVVFLGGCIMHSK
jgi:hypothetical protein